MANVSTPPDDYPGRRRSSNITQQSRNSRANSDAHAQTDEPEAIPQSWIHEAPGPDGTGHTIERLLGPAISRMPPGSERTPARSFYHRSFHGSLGAGQYFPLNVRDRTAEIESLALSDADSIRGARSFPGPGYDGFSPNFEAHMAYGSDRGGLSPHARLHPERIEERSEPITPATESSRPLSSGESALTAMLRNSPPLEQNRDQADPFSQDFSRIPTLDLPEGMIPERTPLVQSSSGPVTRREYGSVEEPFVDVEREPGFRKRSHTRSRFVSPKQPFRWHNLNPKSWSRKSIWDHCIAKPASFLPAVLLGLLLNILDALSYGMILFPLGEPVFADMGPDGISMFYLSTIISQLVFSSGGSIFKGGVTSEMIEVVPFFHKMALMILERVGPDNPKSVLATTILAYAMSAVLTGTVFFLMGAARLGSLIGFFPRHILIGCIGGVGWFLVVTGVEISARISGNLEYNLVTLKKLFQLDTIPLWTVPLALAILFLVVKRFIKSNFLVGGYFFGIGLVFYFFTTVLGIPVETLRDKDWVFAAPRTTEPWYHFYSLYDFSAVDWQALADTVPAMFALTFFGVLHVPINVPALGISTGEDNLSVNRELLAHGVSNVISGCVGSVQNYLVYTNSLLFIGSGGNSRLAGIMLAFGTIGVMIAGPALVGYIPIMVVAALIYMLGIELMEEALVDTWGRLHKLEYITVVIIVVTMGAWDFVTGIFVGIILACVNFVMQTAQKSAITGMYTGQTATSTVRRHPLHVRFLREAGRQTVIIKLAGLLFFGTIVSVEKRVRSLIEDEMFNRRPIRFLVLDLSHVNGLDFSAAEAFTRLNRILRRRRVQMILSGVDLSGSVGKSLQNVGLFQKQNGVGIFENLNSALEYCENDLLKALHSGKHLAADKRDHNAAILDILHPPVPSMVDVFNSPRGLFLNQVAATALQEEGEASPYSAMQLRQSKYPRPLGLLRLAFQGMTDTSDDFWAVTCPYFTRAEYPASSVLYRAGDIAQNFMLLESGMLRAEYDTPQGSYFELIVAGRPCGELPFFSETRRTATVRAERDSVVWMMGMEGWQQLCSKHPMVAQELMKVCLKLTTERMESITSYVLTATR